MNAFSNNSAASITPIDWVQQKPAKVTFRCIQTAIKRANRATHPVEKKIAWSHVYKLSDQYKKQEEENHQ